MSIEEFEKDFELSLEYLSLIDELAKERDELIRFRESNLPVNVKKCYKDFENNKRSLKSDLKKSNAFVKKLKNINSEGIIQCIRDIETLNLSLFISEIVSAIVSTTYKVS